MCRTVVIKGRLVGPSTVELDEPLPDDARDVEVSAQVPDGPTGMLSEYLRSLPSGTRTKDDIDRQVREERGDWPR